MDFWWCLPWVSKSGLNPCLPTSSYAYNGLLRIISGVRPGHVNRSTILNTIFTVRNSSCGKVMFSQASVILSTGRGRASWVVCVAGCHCSFLSDRLCEKNITEINPNKISGEKHLWSYKSDVLISRQTAVVLLWLLEKSMIRCVFIFCNILNLLKQVHCIYRWKKNIHNSCVKSTFVSWTWSMSTLPKR